MKRVLFIASVISLLFIVSKTNAQTITPPAGGLITNSASITSSLTSSSSGETTKKYGIVFPIVQLGNCANLSECKNYCSDSANSAACIAYAKQKGFYKNKLADDKEKVLAAAKTTLGCGSVDECKAICELPENYEKCSNFAKDNGLNGGIKAKVDSSEIIDKAKTILGCDSADSCKALCQNPSNSQRCTQFARQENLNGGEHVTGPGGCTSPATCQAFCQNPTNAVVCQQFIQQKQQVVQTAVPTGQVSQSQAQEDFCHSHPDQCPPPSIFPTKNPSITFGPTNYYNQAQQCVQKPGCKFSAATLSCVCTTVTSTVTNDSVPTQISSPTHYPTPTPANTQTSTSNTSGFTTPTPTPTPTVLGVATQAPGQSIFQKIFRFLLSR